MIYGLSRDWWMWQMYRQVADFINEPNDISEARLKSLVLAYRKYHDVEQLNSKDEEQGRVVDLG